MQSLPIESATLRVPQPFTRLTSEERSELAAWCEAARSAGIDGVEDLGVRPWPVPNAAAILGVYRSGAALADWLVVGRSGDWAVACCADGQIIGSAPTLIDALRVLYQVRDTIHTA